MDCSMPGLPVHHQLPQFTQTHIHQVGDAILPSHPLSSPSLPTFSLSQHQALLQSGGQSIGVSASASVLPMNIQHWFPLGWTGEYTINIWWMTISQELSCWGIPFSHPSALQHWHHLTWSWPPGRPRLLRTACSSLCSAAHPQALSNWNALHIPAICSFLCYLCMSLNRIPTYSSSYLFPLEVKSCHHVHITK